MMQKGRIYISGPISGRDLGEARAHFAKAEKTLRWQGYRTINPLRMWLPVWLARHGCGGARTERSLAMALDITLKYENYKPRRTGTRAVKKDYDRLVNEGKIPHKTSVLSE